MKNSTVAARRRAFRAAVVAAGLNPETDFFALDFSEIAKVDEIRKSFNFSGRNYLGRSRCRQFWYAVQAAK